MSDVKEQYEAFPYPARDPKDEAKRLISGSPSFPVEMDHHLWGGQRDWSKPLRALFAGGGTGDGLIQLAQRLVDAGRPYDITYLDLSATSRGIAEARAKERGLNGITFRTGSLLDAAEHGPFDYIDCCGVLHHLDDPLTGLRALRRALAQGGGLGFMVYAPYGRTGVYPLQDAFNRLYGHLPAKSQLKHAKKTFAAIPKTHPLHRNPHIGDHRQGDAGFFDLLVHSTDQPFRIDQWISALDETGWSLCGMTRPGLYDLSLLTDVPDQMVPSLQMATAEELRGTIKAHVGYARAREAEQPSQAIIEDRVPHLTNVPAQALSQAVAAGKIPPLQMGQEQINIVIKADCAPLISLIDGKRTVSEIGAKSGLEPAKTRRLWSAIDAALCPWGSLHYSRVLV